MQHSSSGPSRRGSAVRRVPVLGLVSLLALASGSRIAAAGAAEPVTTQSLLKEMIDRDAMAQWPAPAYSLRQASSYDRRKTNPADAATWHTNDDHEKFIRTEENQDRHEWVIMDDTGPGAITRFWTPLWDPKDHQVVRFYFDGAASPTITVNFNDLLSGKAFVRPPFAFVSWNDLDLADQLKPDYKAERGVGADLYVPIPFAKGCKITLDSVPFYYGINYRIYEAGTTVKTFSMDDLKAAQPVVDDISKVLLAAPATPEQTSDKPTTLAPGDEIKLDLPGGNNAVRNLSVLVDPKDAPQVLRSAVLEGTFDDEQTIWCPVGEFFGVGARLRPVIDWQRTVSADGAMNARWTMPYQRSARLALKNTGSKPLVLKLAAATSAFKWDDRSLYFHANWHSQHGINTRPMSDWNYIQIEGQGVYVGDTLTAFTPVSPWYGEGDERIYIDGEKVPSQIGTGTEDYYGYAWGMAIFFNSPFISTPLRDVDTRDSWRGYTTDSRLRLLDAIPFTKSLKHDMEIWNWADTQVDYAVGVFWYARAGAKYNREPQPDETVAPIKETPPGDPPVTSIPGAIECEKMTITGKSLGVQTEVQSGGLKSGKWSGGKQLLVQAKKIGDFVELEIPVSDNRPRKVTLYATKSYDFGIVQFSVNGEVAAVPPGPKVYTPTDLYNVDPVASGPIELGLCEPYNGKFVLRAEVVGSKAPGKDGRFYFGLDCVVVEPDAGAPPATQPKAEAAPAPGLRPNLVIILIDDMGYGDIEPFYDKCKNRTPRLNQMAAEGMKLTSFYAAPVCTPSRAQLLTGCYAKRVGLPDVIAPDCPIGISSHEHTIAELLRNQGYATMAIGKWHVGDQIVFLPTRHGFDHYLGLPYSNDMGGEWDGAPDTPPRFRAPPLPLVRDDKVIRTLSGPDQDQLVQIYTDEAVKFIREHKDGPFFLYLPHTAVHVPIHPGEKYRGKSHNGRYGDWVEETDASVGTVLDTLKELKIDRNTLVFFTSDNGPWLLMGTDGGSAGPLRGGKGGTYEGGMREPTIAWWPGHIAPRSTSDTVAGEIDLLPTYVKLAGGAIPEDRKIDGGDMTPLLLGQTTESPREAQYYFYSRWLQAVRSGPWKLAVNVQKVAHAIPLHLPPGATGFVPTLYNLDSDIAETKDVAADHPDVVKRLRALADKMDADLGASRDGPGVRSPGRVESPTPLLMHG